MTLFKYKILVLTLLSFFLAIDGLSQNEPYHGGIGDGFSYSNNSFNMSDVAFEGNPLTVTINQAGNQADPAEIEPVVFTVVFSEPVNDFDPADFVMLGGAVSHFIEITGSGANYTVQMRNIRPNGNLIVQIPAGAVHNSVGRPNQVSTSTDNSVVFNGAEFAVEIKLATGQSYYSNKDNVHFILQFSEDAYDLTASDIEITGTAFASSVSITGSGALYDVKVSGMTQDGSVIIKIPEERVFNSLGKGNIPSINTGNLIMIDYTSPAVEITQETGQNDPALTLPLNFHVEFSENVEDFYPEYISYGASDGVYLQISGSGSNYIVSAYGVQTNETITITLGTNAAHDLAGNYNNQSINIDNSITYIGVTAINKIENKNCLIYFNGENLIIKFNDFPENKTMLHIYDLSGKIIYSKEGLHQFNSFSIPQSSLYIVRVKNGNDFFYKLIPASK